MFFRTPRLPLGCAEIGAVLFGEILKIDPSTPTWLNRDRFILSAGHGSMFLYSWLHISGFDLSIEDLKSFRLKGSKTPGHPEFGETPGVEVTSGPLGQGIGNAVGMAISEKMAAATFNSADFKVFDHKVWCLAGDGCMQEGVSAESAAIAAVEKLGNLVLLYDSNDVTLDAMADKTMTEDVGKRYEAYGWEVSKCDGHNIDEIRKALTAARDSASDKPKLVIFKTTIAKGIPEVENSAKGHGEGGAKFAEAARSALGLPAQKFFVGEETYAYFKAALAKRREIRAKWDCEFAQWQKANPADAEKLEACLNRKKSGKSAEELLKLIPEFPLDDKSATRASGGKIMNVLAKALPYMVTGRSRPFRLNQELSQRNGRLLGKRPQGTQHMVRHPRTRNGRDFKRHSLLRNIRTLMRHVFDICRLYARFDSRFRAVEAAHAIRFHARFNRRRNGRPDPPACRNGVDSPLHTPPRRGATGGFRRMRGGLGDGACEKGRPDSIDSFAPKPAAFKLHTRTDKARGNAERRIYCQEGNCAAEKNHNSDRFRTPMGAESGGTGSVNPGRFDAFDGSF